MEYRTVYVVELPWGEFRWTEDYRVAYQLATGETVADGGDDHPEEDRITAWHVETMPECPDVCPQCGEDVEMGSARWNGWAWEHKSDEAHPQAGHHVMREEVLSRGE